MERAGWNARGTRRVESFWVECPWNVLGRMPVEHAVWSGMPVERAEWNARGTCWVECPWNVLGGMPMEHAEWNAHGTCWVECPWRNAHGTCWVECPLNVLGGMPIACAGWNLVGDNPSDKEWVECPYHACQLAGGMPAAGGARNDESDIGMRDGTWGRGMLLQESSI